MVSRKGTSAPSETASLWPADKVKRWPIEDLIAYADNARLHSEEQVEQLASSIR
jgi:hypothetical protein